MFNINQNWEEETKFHYGYSVSFTKKREKLNI